MLDDIAVDRSTVDAASYDGSESSSIPIRTQCLFLFSFQWFHLPMIAHDDEDTVFEESCLPELEIEIEQALIRVSKRIGLVRSVWRIVGLMEGDALQDNKIRLGLILDRLYGLGIQIGIRSGIEDILLFVGERFFADDGIESCARKERFLIEKFEIDRADERSGVSLIMEKDRKRFGIGSISGICAHP